MNIDGSVIESPCKFEGASVSEISAPDLFWLRWRGGAGYQDRLAIDEEIERRRAARRRAPGTRRRIRNGMDGLVLNVH